MSLAAALASAYGASPRGWSGFLSRADFISDLLYTAIPQRAATGTTATFTRATTKTWPNNDGYLVTGLAGEIGFVGARRIDNLIRLGAAQSSTLAVAASVTMTLPAGAYQFSMGAGTGTATFSGTGGATGTLAASASGRTFVAKTISAGTLIVTASVATLIDIQVVSMVAETDQTTAREYVSVGVASAPYYHGSGVDGVKCFPTDISGNPIPSTTLLGYSAEGARTNLARWSNALATSPWNDPTGGGADLSATNNQYVASDGTTTMAELTANATTSFHVLRQGGISFTAAVYTVSVELKYVDHKWVGLQMYDGTNSRFCSFDLLNGAVGSASAGSTGRIEALANGNFRCQVSGTMGVTASGLVDIALNNTDASSEQNYLATGTKVGAWGVQVEPGSFASSYIPTTTVAVTRNADVLTYSSVGNIDGTKGWCYAEISADWGTPPPSNYCAIGFGTSIEGLITGSVAGLPTEIRAFDGTNSVQQAGNPTMYRTPRNTAVTWGGSSMSVGQSGVVTAGSFDGNIGTTAIGVGNSGAGAFQWFGTIRNIRIGQRQLSASEMQAITA